MAAIGGDLDLVEALVELESAIESGDIEEEAFSEDVGIWMVELSEEGFVENGAPPPAVVFDRHAPVFSPLDAGLPISI